MTLDLYYNQNYGHVKWEATTTFNSNRFHWMCCSSLECSAFVCVCVCIYLMFIQYSLIAHVGCIVITRPFILLYINTLSYILTFSVYWWIAINYFMNGGDPCERNIWSEGFFLAIGSIIVIDQRTFIYY